MNQSIAPNASSQLLSSLAKESGFERCGVTRLENPVTLDFYKSWLEEDLHGEMTYLQTHLNVKEDPTLLLKEAKTSIVVAVDYFDHPAPFTEEIELKVARYARGRDYHLWLKEKLEVFITGLKSRFPDEFFLAATDSKPLLERDLAYRAGLGWFGKNTCLIDQKHGSFFLLGEILTTLDIASEISATNMRVAAEMHVTESDSAHAETVTVFHPDRCGTCTRCIDACPTGALIAPKKMDSRQCISYLTIESKQLPPEELRGKIGDWFFGCDICQEVCPWNEKVFGKKLNKTSSISKTVNELRFFLTASNREIEERFKDSPLLRARPFGLRRNAIIVATNLKFTELRPEIKRYKSDERLQSLVDWALDRLSYC